MSKKIYIEEYNKKMDKIIAKGLSVEDTLIELLEEAAKYEIKKYGSLKTQFGTFKNRSRKSNSAKKNSL